MFVRGGLSDGNPNPYQAWITGGLGGKGLIPGRPDDSFGIAYFYHDFSDDLSAGFQRVSRGVSAFAAAVAPVADEALRGQLFNLAADVSSALDFEDESGVEIYYNYAVTPWMGITADLQILETAARANETAVIGGLRVNIRF